MDPMRSDNALIRCWNVSPPTVHFPPILWYMRAGVITDTKYDHQRIGMPTDVELLALQDEMPALLFAGLPDKQY